MTVIHPHVRPVATSPREGLATFSTFNRSGLVWPTHELSTRFVTAATQGGNYTLPELPSLLPVGAEAH